MKIATLNINSVNARMPNLAKWLNDNSPDVMLLQEIKTEFNNFPFFEPYQFFSKFTSFFSSRIIPNTSLSSLLCLLAISV